MPAAPPAPRLSAPAFCSRCGSPVPAGSEYCPRCGSRVEALSGGPPLPAQAPYTPPQAWAARTPPKKPNRTLWIVIVVVVVAAVAVIALVAYIASSDVDVTAINLVSTDDACSVTGHTFGGFTAGRSTSEVRTLSIPNSGSSACTITSVDTLTLGFSVSGANVPLTIPAEGTESLSFTIGVPPFAYTGVLTLDVE
jgi:hypothetical protein